LQKDTSLQHTVYKDVSNYGIDTEATF